MGSRPGSVPIRCGVGSGRKRSIRHDLRTLRLGPRQGTGYLDDLGDWATAFEAALLTKPPASRGVSDCRIEEVPHPEFFGFTEQPFHLGNCLLVLLRRQF